MEFLRLSRELSLFFFNLKFSGPPHLSFRQGGWGSWKLLVIWLSRQPRAEGAAPGQEHDISENVLPHPCPLQYRGRGTASGRSDLGDSSCLVEGIGKRGFSDVKCDSMWQRQYTSKVLWSKHSWWTPESEMGWGPVLINCWKLSLSPYRWQPSLPLGVTFTV